MKLIALHNKDGEVVAYTRVDDADYTSLSRHKWHLTSEGYVGRNAPMVNRERGATIRMHREVLGFPDSSVDHKNGDTLDNQRHNLRACSKRDNNRNSRKTRSSTTSRYKGVVLRSDTGKWQAYIEDGRQISLGYHTVEEDAARAYDRKAIELFGEFARTNFPLEDYL
jgi:HNH endonuclease